MKKSDLVKASKNGFPDHKKMVDSIFREINRAIINCDEVTIHNFGTFKVVKSKVRYGYNFHTKQRIPLPEKLKIKFKPSPKIVKRLNEANLTKSPGIA